MEAHNDAAVEVVAAAGDAADAGEDGDFVTLREIRETRIPEEVDLSSLAEVLSRNPDHQVDPANIHASRPTSSRFRKLTAVVGDSWLRWTELTDAALSGSANFKEAVMKAAYEVPLSSNLLQNPLNRQNILHFVLDLGDPEVTEIVVEIADADLIDRTFDVDVVKITGKKTALHQVVEKNNLPLLKKLLGKIDNRTKKISLLCQETPVEIKGQRPRTFPSLHLAAYYGLKEIVEHIVEVGVDVNHLNAKNDTALLWAARWGHIDTVRSLLLRGAQPDLVNDKGSTALYWAVRYGHADTVEVLAAEGKADVSKQRKLGLVAPIVLASAFGLSKTLAVLLKYGANPNTTIRGNERPIHHAAKEGFSEIIELLVAHGAEVDAADVRGDTALLLAARYGSAKALQTLLKHGAALDHKNVMGENVWKSAISCSSDVIIKILVGHQRRLEEGVEDGLNSQSSSTAGTSSLLFLAAAAGNVSKISLLFKIKVDANITDENGNTFIHTAAINNHPQVIDKFHKMVNIDAVNSDGNTVLHLACSRGNHEVIAILIKLKAMANIRNGKGETPLHVAARCRSIQAGTISMLMDFVIKTHSWECLNMQDNNRNNALHIAAKHVKPDVLWEFRFVSLKDADNEGNTALHSVIRSSSPEVLDTMIDIFDVMKRDCDINHKNRHQETPLFLAAREGLLGGVERLMLFGADISVAGPEGNTVLHMLTSLTVSRPAQCQRYLEVFAAILEKATVWYSSMLKLKRTDRDQDHLFIRRRAVLKLVTDISNTSGLTVLDLACKVGASEVVKLLVSMENVMAFQTDRSTRYDITNLIPGTNGSVGVSLPGKKVLPRLSCLDWLLVSGRRSLSQSAASVLDIQPFHDIEAAYGAVANWSYAAMMIVHILYMSVFSWSGLAVLKDSRLRPGERTVTGQSLATYVIVPLEPLVILIYNIYRMFIFCCSGEVSIKNKLAQKSHILNTSLVIFVSLVYCLFVVAWIVMYATDFIFMDIFLSIALCIGWMLSIAFTRGFKVINYFWRLIKILIVRDVFKFLFIYFFVLLAFSFAFHVLFQVSQDVVNQYPNPIYTVYLMFNMMIGTQYIFDDGVVSPGLIAEGRDDVFMKVLYILYMILATIVLLNILIAMMNDSYQEIRESQQMTWRIESVALGVDVEQSVPFLFHLFSKVKITHGYICPSDENHNVLRWYIDVASTQDGLILDASRPAPEDGQEAVSELKSKVSSMDLNLSGQLHSLRSSVGEIQSLLKGLEQTLGASRKN